MTEPDPTDTTPESNTDAIRAEIEQTRADLSDTVDQLADKLNVKAQVGSKAEAARDSVVDKAAELKASAPEPVQHALDRAGETVGPVAHRVNVQTEPYRGKIVLGVVGLVVALVVLRRVRRSEDDS